jgi:hypothetical protein
MEWFVFIFTVVLVLFVAAVAHASKVIKQMRKDYQDSLQQLKQHPNDPDLREQTLALGRKYADRVRNHNGRSIFDEVALMNDINAACARATVGQHSVARVEVTNRLPMRGASVAQEIENLGRLFLKGVITAEEFERGKAAFLGAPPDKAATAVDLLQNLSVLKAQGVLSESEFNMKKWEILSERLIPGKRQAATLQKQPTSSPRSGFRPAVPSLPCPSCGKGIPVNSIVPGMNACPHCQSAYEAET